MLSRVAFAIESSFPPRATLPLRKHSITAVVISVYPFIRVAEWLHAEFLKWPGIKRQSIIFFTKVVLA